MPLTRRKYLALLTTSAVAASEESLSDQWRRIASTTDGIVGAAALHLKSGRYVSLNGQERLIEQMVAQSDNTAVQTLFRIGGEAPAVAASFARWRVTGIGVDRYEGECALQAHGVTKYPPVDRWTPGIVTRLIAKVPMQIQYLGTRKFVNDPRDSGTPNGTANLLARLFKGELLSAQSTAQLKTILEKTTTGKERLKGLLPPGTIVAHKTGTMGTIKGLNGATNDVGVIMHPGTAGELAIAVYIKGSTRDERTRDRIIAQIARAVYVAFQS